MLMSAGIDLPRGYAVGGWLLVDNEKMSKSTGNVVKPLDMVDTVGVDGLRYYVLADTAYGNDGDFTRDGLVGRYNADLANNLGNLAPASPPWSNEVRWHRPGTERRRPPRRCRRGQAVAGASRRLACDRPEPALEATWRLIRATNAQEIPNRNQ